MKRKIDIEAILAPLPGENPAGEDLRYSSIYEEIKEARRADDPLDRGDWKREIKTSDWDKVITIAVEALTKKTKDLQIAAWLTEALIQPEGFSGLASGLNVILGLMGDYWDRLYPAIEDGDLEFRAAPLQFVNDKLWPSIKQVSLTDAGVTPGYSWLQWKDSREVGHESDTLNRSGDVDESRKRKRDELIAEGKLTAEAFDSAVALTSKAYYESLLGDLNLCLEAFKKLDQFVDEKFGPSGPRLADFGKALEDCAQVVMKIYKEQKGGVELGAKPGPGATKEVVPQSDEKIGVGRELHLLSPSEQKPPVASPPVQVAEFSDLDSFEKVLWAEAVQIMKTSGIKNALDKLLGASHSAPSVRARNRFRLLMAKLCLEADRLDLARPIVEELNALIEELHLERWESPLWIAEVLEVLYQCLTRGHPSDEDVSRGKILFERLCKADVTKALIYKS